MTEGKKPRVPVGITVPAPKTDPNQRAAVVPPRPASAPPPPAYNAQGDRHTPPPPTPPAPPSAAPPSDDERWMDLALVHAKNGRPSPNPHVGAVLVKDGELVATGHHERAGGEHAEIQAIRGAGVKAAGATLYVTLEPCNHHGRTPPCTDAIIAAKIARVVVGCRDPNPHVEGQGIEKLRNAGVEVVLGVREHVARFVIAPWTKHITTGLPYVSLKLALSLFLFNATASTAS